MMQRMITSFAIMAFVFPPLFFGGLMLDALIILFVLFGVFEIISSCFKKFDYLLYATTVVYILSSLILSFDFVIIMLPILLLILFIFVIANEDMSVDKISIVFVVICLVLFTVYAIKTIYLLDKYVMFFILIATYMCDTGAYFTGRFFGKHKLNPRISPKKTIEGSIGGWVLGASMSLLFAYFVLPEFNTVIIVVSAICLPIVSQIGDLAFSAIKRHLDVKDFGNLLPGHGGVLDRIDSLIFNLIIFISIMNIYAYFG